MRGERRPGRYVTSAAAAGLLAAALTAPLAGGSSASARQGDQHAIRSFDDTKIAFNWFPAVGLAAGERAPTVLQGPGFGGKGETDPDAPDGDVIPGVGWLRRHGYNVLTWNPRGISPSGGRAQLNSVSFEGRDTSALISWVARQPEALLDGPADPRVGMTGGSYGGGIQFTTAAIDHRIDAIVPVIAWHSLMTSLYRARTIKTSWVKALVALASLPGNRFDPAILKGAAQAERRRTFTPDVVAFGRAAGPARLVAGIRAPTLIIQGTIDNLFPPSEAVANYRVLRRQGVRTKMAWFCGGHGFCMTESGDSSIALRQARRWLARYLKGRSVGTGPGFLWVDQRGRYRSAKSYPGPRGEPLEGRGQGRLVLVANGGSGPYEGPLPSDVPPLQALFLRPTIPTRATNAVDVRVRASRRTVVLGAPRLRLTYRGTAPNRSVRVLAQLLDDKTGKVLGNQITPIRLRLDGKRREVRRSLEVVSATVGRRRPLTLQIVAQSSAYNVFPNGGSVRFSRIRVALPTYAGR